MPGIDHIVLTVADIDRTREFYEHVLEIKAILFEDGFYFMAGEVAVFIFPSSRNSGKLGLDHIAFAAKSEDDLSLLIKRLSDYGQETKGIEIFKATSNRYVWFQDMDGNSLELWLPNSNS